MTTKGVVIGKFYPLHKGHLHLIDTALAHCDHLAIIIAYRADEAIDGRIRATWLEQLYPQATVLARLDDNFDQDDSKFWADQTIAWLGYKPDIAFTSEDYGWAWTQHMGCRHMLVDKLRLAVPTSGTAIRNDTIGNWPYLSPPAANFLTTSIVVVGAESTGTTTLSQDLAKHYHAPWVPEYGRYYSQLKSDNHTPDWSSWEFDHIAQAQNNLHQATAKQAKGLVIADTDSLATAIWHERYLGHWSDSIEPHIAPPPDLYIVTSPDIPFVQDGTRDGQHLRLWMHERFLQVLKQRGCPFIVVKGTPQQRLRQATTAIDQLPRRHIFSLPKSTVDPLTSQ